MFFHSNGESIPIAIWNVKIRNMWINRDDSWLLKETYTTKNEFISSKIPMLWGIGSKKLKRMSCSYRRLIPTSKFDI